MIDREGLRELLINKYNISKMDYPIIDKIVEEIYDVNQKTVIPFTELETYVFRKKYGIYSSNIMIPENKIAMELNLTDNKISSIIGTCLTKMSFRINKIEKRVKIPKMSSFDIKASRDIFVSNFGLDNFIINSLLKREIYTLRELLEYSKIELSKIISKKALEEIILYVHNLGYLFIEELSIDEEKNIISKSDLERVNNSSIYFVNSVKNIDARKINKLNIKNIKDLYERINLFSREEKQLILRDIIYENVQRKSIFDYTIDELMDSSVSVLDINRNTFETLEKFGIETIRSLVSLEKSDVKKILQDDVKTNLLINKVHSLGLAFLDEIELMSLYTETISDELKKSR